MHILLLCEPTKYKCKKRITSITVNLSALERFSKDFPVSCFPLHLLYCQPCGPQPARNVGFSCPWHVESSWTRDQTCVPALEGRFLPTIPPGKSGFFIFKQIKKKKKKPTTTTKHTHTYMAALGLSFGMCDLPP